MTLYRLFSIFCTLGLVLQASVASSEVAKTMQINPATPEPSRFVVRGSSLVDLKHPEKPLFFRGIGYSPFLPGETPVRGLQPANDDRYAHHLALIKEMNANYLHVFPRLMPPKFFQALDKTDLAYSQDVWVWAYEEDFLAPEFQKKTLDDIKEVIDYTYKVGRPDKLVLFSIGDELQAKCITSTDARHPDVHDFHGKYLSLTNRTPTEIALAKLVDGAMEYELSRYGRRHLYCHTSWTHVGPIGNRPDIEVSQESVLVPDMGDLICLNIYTYANGVKTSPPGSVTGTAYQGYLEQLAKEFHQPILVTQVGLSTSPIAPRADIPGFGGHKPEEVPPVLASVWRDIDTTKGKERFCGVSIFELQDEWWKSAKGPEASLHQDEEDPEQWFGVYSVDAKGTLTAKGDIPKRIRLLFATP
ncbi:MAG: hypothetical protein PHI97_23870 [Desulfobulbus sp.]|nr:hypothetical protein [Desulfobulbus sp.]